MTITQNLTPVENDCEDQGFTRISDGCYKCRVQFVRTARVGHWWWTCPKCNGSFGEAPAPIT